MRSIRPIPEPVPAVKREGDVLDEDILPASKRLTLNEHRPFATTTASSSSQHHTTTTSAPVIEVEDIKMSNGDGHSDEEEEGYVPRLTKRDKGKAKMRLAPLLPEEIWKRVFEIYYDQAAEDWHATGTMKGGLLPLLISPIYTSVATSVLYAHPHISRGSIESFIKCAQLPSKHNDVLAKKQMVRHLTIRPTLVEPNGDNPTIHPVHPSFSQLTLLVPFLQSFTLKDTLVLDIADAENLFSGLRHIQPRKARIELRMWNLHGTAVGADLMAATKPNIHARGFPVQKEKWGYGRESSWLQAIANTRDYDMPAVWLDPRPPNDPNNPNPAAPAAHNIPANLAQQQGAATFAATVAGNRRLATLMARYNGQPGSSRLHSRLRTLSSGNHAALGAAVALSSSDDWLGLSNDSDDSEDSDDGGPDAEHHDADEEGNRSSRSHGGRQRRRRGLSAPPTAPETSGSSTGPGAHAGAGAGPSVSQSAATVESDDTRSAEARPARLDAVDRLTGPVGQATDWTSLDQFDNIEDLDEDQLDLLRQVFDECRSTGADLRNHPCALIRKLPGPAPPSTIHTQAQSTSGGADAIGSDSVAAQSIATPGSSTTATQATSAPQVGPAQVNEPAPQSHRMTGQSGPDEAEIPPVMFSVVATDHDHETEGPAQEELLPPAIVNGSDAGPTTTQNQSPTQISAPDGLSIPAGPLPPNHWSHRERALTVAQRGRTDHIYYPPADDDFPPLAGPSNSTASDNNINNRPRSLLASRPAPPGPNPTPAVARVLADTGALSQSVRGMLLKLLTGHWAESVNAFSFVAFDPAASLAVRAPALDFWTEVPINHIRVHLPLGVNSLAVFKGAKQNARDRLRNRAAALAAAAAAGDDADGSASPDPYGHGARLDALLAGGEEDDEEVVGGDGAGGGLVHPSNRLFEIEVNTVREMQDDMWARAGSQLPPQVCRILLGEQDWASVRTGTARYASTDPAYEDDLHHSPATADYPSPTYSFSSFDSGSDQGMYSDMGDGDGDDRVAGESYDAEAAKLQLARLAAKKAKKHEGEGDE